MQYPDMDIQVRDRVNPVIKDSWIFFDQDRPISEYLEELKKACYYHSDGSWNPIDGIWIIPWTPVFTAVMNLMATSCLKGRNTVQRTRIFAVVCGYF